MTDDLLGRQLDEYQLETLLGKGGMARVYRGLDVNLNRYAAVKVIDIPFRDDSDYMKRFKLEARAIAQLEHPHIVRLYRYGEADGLLYMAMQYVEGVDLLTILSSYEADGEFMEPADISRVIREACLALDYAHSKGVVHRDVKPSNIMLSAGGQAVLTDFGLALLTEVGTKGEIFGTPQYIAPEQAISSAGAVPQSDLYAIGVILYRIFTGALPFDGDDPLEVAMWHMTEVPTPPSQLQPGIRSEVEAVILRILAKEPENRYRDGVSLADALDDALFQAKGISAPATAPRLSIMERVDLTAEALPPLPAAVSPPISQQEAVESPFAVSTLEVATESLPTRIEPLTLPAVDPRNLSAESAPKRKSPINQFTIGIILLVLLAVAVLLFWPDDPIQTEDDLVAENVPASVNPTPTLSASATAAETRTPSQIIEAYPAPDDTTSIGDTSDAYPGPIEGSEDKDITPTTQPLPTTEVTPTPEPILSEIAGGEVWLPIVLKGNEASVVAATIVPESPTALPTQPPANYDLLLIKDGKTLFIVNQTPGDFPLSGFTLVMGNRDDEILSQWDLVNLESNACIIIRRDDKEREQSLPDNCAERVATIVFRWKDDFEAHYGEYVAECKVSNRERCQVSIPAP